MAAHERTSLCDIHEIAARLGMNVRWIRRKVAAREIPFVKLGRLLRFDPDEIDDWLERARVPTAAELLDDEPCGWATRHAGDRRGVAGPPFRPVTSIHAKSRARHPSAGREPDGLDPPSAS